MIEEMAKGRGKESLAQEKFKSLFFFNIMIYILKIGKKSIAVLL